MSTETPEVNEVELYERVGRTVTILRKNFEAKGIAVHERAAIGACLLAQAFVEMSTEEDHPREMFVSAIGMLDTAFACVEGVEDENAA